MPDDQTKKEQSGSLDSVVSGIIIPRKAPPGIITALRNFVAAIEEYDKSGVWPDNYTLRKLATEGRDALNCGYSANAPLERRRDEERKIDNGND